jgi:hypothetical protein
MQKDIVSLLFSGKMLILSNRINHAAEIHALVYNGFTLNNLNGYFKDITSPSLFKQPESDGQIFLGAFAQA